MLNGALIEFDDAVNVELYSRWTHYCRAYIGPSTDLTSIANADYAAGVADLQGYLADLVSGASALGGGLDLSGLLGDLTGGLDLGIILGVLGL